MLTQADIKLLEFEETHPRNTGLKTDAIRHLLGLTAPRYYQRLHWLVRQRDVIEQYPQLAYRIQRRVDRKREERDALLRALE